MIKAKFSIVIPVFNEAQNIEKLINEVSFNLKNCDYQLIIVNDGSIDNTLDIIKKIKCNNIELINFEKNYGQSYSIYNGIKHSKNNIIVTLDGDLQNDPSDIRKLLEIYTNNDEIKLISGIRKNRKDTFLKIVSSKIANFIRSLLLKDNCPDTGCSLKVFDRSIFLKIIYFNGIHRFIPTFFENMGFKALYVNVNHRKRIAGISNYGTIDRLIRGIIDLYKVKKILSNMKNND